MKNRRSLGPTVVPPDVPPVPPPDGHPQSDVHAMRRGGARLDVSARVSLRDGNGQELVGWALNLSRGGVRVILEENVEPGSTFEVTLTGTTGVHAPPIPVGPQSGRVVWVQREPDGVVAGIAFRRGADKLQKS